SQKAQQDAPDVAHYIVLERAHGRTKLEVVQLRPVLDSLPGVDHPGDIGVGLRRRGSRLEPCNPPATKALRQQARIHERGIEAQRKYQIRGKSTHREAR